MKFRHNDSGSCSCISCVSKNGSFTSLKRIIRTGSRANKLHYGSNIPAKERKLLDKLVATRADYNKLRSEIISSSEKLRSLRRDDAEGPNVLELIRLVDKGEALGYNELTECCSCCICDPLMAHHTHTKKQRHGHPGRARTVRAEYSSRSIVTSRPKELRPNVRFNAKNVHSDPCTCTTTLSAVFKRQSEEMVNKLRPREKQRSMPSESFAREVANKRNKRPVQKYLQKIKHSETKMKQALQDGARKSLKKIKHSETKMKQALQDGARKSLKKIKQSKSNIMDRQHFEISTDLIRSARDNMKRQKRAGSKSSEELEAKLLEDTANLDRKIKSEARNTSKKISKLVKKSKLKLRQSVEPLIRKSAERIQELEAKRKLGQHMCECPGIQAELTKMAKRSLDKHKRTPTEMLDFDKDIQEPKVSFNRKMANEIKKSARKVTDFVQDSQTKLRENVEVLAKKSVETIKQLDAQRKLPEIKAEVVIKAKQSLNRQRVQSETIPVVETTKKPLKYNSKMNAVLQSSKEKNNALTDAVKESKVMDRKHYGVSTELIRSVRDNTKRQKRAGSKSSEELEPKVLEDTANLDRKIKSVARNTSKKISKIVKKSKLKLKQSVEPLIRKSVERIQELEAKRKLGQHMCECPGIQAELTKMAKRNLDKHKRAPTEMLDFDKDIQEPKVSFNRKMANEIKKSARKVTDFVQDSQTKQRENVEVLAKKSVETIKQLDAQRKLPEIKAEVVIKPKQSLNRPKVQSETIPVLESTNKPLKYNSKMNAVLQSSKEKYNALTDAVKESKTKLKKIVTDKQKANETSTSETSLEPKKRFKIKKDSKEKYQETLIKKKALKEWECEPPCFSETCIPQECYKRIINRKAKFAELRNINRLGDKQMVEKSLSNINAQVGTVKRKERRRNKFVKAIKNLSKSSGVGVKATQLEKTKGTNVKKKFVKKGGHSNKETSQRKYHETNQTKKLKPNSVHSMTKFGNAKHAKTSSENSMRSVSSSASETKKLKSEPQAKRRAKPKHKRSIGNIKHVKPTQRGKRTQDRKQYIKSVSNLVNLKNKTKATKTRNKINSKMQERKISEYEIPSDESKVQRKRRDRDNQIALNVTRSHLIQSQNSIFEKSTTTKGLKNGLHKCPCSIEIGTNQFKRMKMKKKGTLASDQSRLQIFRSSATDTDNAPFEPLPDGYCDSRNCFTQMRKKKLKRRSTNTIFERRSAGSGNLYRNKKSTSSFTSRSAVFPKNKNAQSAAVFRKSKRSEHKYPEAVMSHPGRHPSRGRRAVRIGSSFSFSIAISKETPQAKPKYIVNKSRTAKWKPNETQIRSQGDGYMLHKKSRESQLVRRRNASKEKVAMTVASLKRCFCTHKLLKSSQNKFNHQNKAYGISRGAESSAPVKQNLKKYLSKHRRSKTAVPTFAVYRQQTYTVSRVTLKENKIPDGNTWLTVPHNQQKPALQPGCFNIPRILSTGSFSIVSIASYPLNELLNLNYYQDANKTSICLLPKENRSHISLASIKSYAFSGSFLINNNEIYERNKFCEKQTTNMIEPPFLKRCVCTVHFQVPGEGNRESDEFQSRKCESGECVSYNCSPSDCCDVRLKKTIETGSTILGKNNKQVPSTRISELGVHIVQSTQISLQRSVFGVGSLSERQTVYRQTVENPYKRKRRRPKLLPYECEPGICIPGECDPYDCLKLIRKRRSKETKSQWGGGVQTSSTAMPLAKQTESLQMYRSRKKDRESYQRRPEKDGMINEQYSTANYSAKRPRRGVRIGSHFSFNVDFSKSVTSPQPVKTESIQKNYEEEDYVEPKKSKKRKRHIQNRERGAQHERKVRHRRSQSDEPTDTSSTMTNNMLKRCFCNATGTTMDMTRVVNLPETRIMNESGTQSTSQVRKRPFRNRRNRIYRRSLGLDPNECEPGFCTPGYCDPYVCLKRIQERSTKVNTDIPRYKSTGSSSRIKRRKGRGRQIQTSRDSRDMMVTTSSGHIRRAQKSQTFREDRDMMIETTPGNLRNSQMQTSHGIEETPVSHDRSSGKQTVRLGSSFDFNVQFSKGTPAPRTEVTYTSSGNVKAIHTASRGTFAPGVEYKHGSSGMDGARYRSKMTSASRPLVNKNISHEAGVGVNMSPEENKDKIRHTKRTGDTKSGLGPLLKRCFCTLAFKKGNLEKFAKVHTSASTDTRENLQEPQNYAKNERTNTRKKYLRGGQKLEPYECEPGVCTPGECDPYECLKRIERRSLYSRGTDPDKRQYRGRGSVSTVSRGIKANRRPQQKHRNVGMGRRRQNTVGTASGFYSTSKGTNARKDRRNRRANTIEGIHYDRTTNVQSSPVSNRRTVRVGSSYNFNVEFSKDAGASTKKNWTPPPEAHHSVNLEKGIQYEGNNMKDTGVYGGKHLRDSYSQADYSTENKNVGTFLKRCFCTLNIQKNKARKQQTKIPYGRYLRSAPTQSNLKRNADNVSRERDAGTRNQMYKLEPYECEPNVCIPGECDPYDCYERIQRRLRDQGVASKNVLRELGTGTGNLDTVYTQPYENEPETNRMRNRRAVGTGSDQPSDISTGTMPYTTNASAASQFGRMRREEGSGTYRNPNREFGSSPEGSHDFGSSPVGSHEFGSSPRERDGKKKQTVKITSEFSFNVDFFKDEAPPKMPEPARPKRKDGRTRAVHTKRRRANRGVGERMYGRDNESQMDNIRKTTSTQHESILKRCFCTLKLQQEQQRKRLITRYPNDQEVYMVETATTRTSSKNQKLLQKLEPYECEPGFCVPTKCDPQVCLSRIKHRNACRVTIGTRHKDDKRKHEKLKASNVVEVPHYPNYFSKPKRVVRVSSSHNFKIEFLKDEPHIFEDQNETSSIKKKQTKLSRFFKGSRSKNKIEDQKQFLKNYLVKSSTKKKPANSKREAVVKKKETVVNTKDTIDNKNKIADSRTNQKGNHEIKVESNKDLIYKRVPKTQTRNSKRSQSSKQDIEDDGKRGLKNKQVMQSESQKDSFVNTRDKFENKIGNVNKRKIKKSVVTFAGHHDYREYQVVSTDTINKPSQNKVRKKQQIYKHNYNDYLGVSTETEDNHLQKNGVSVQKTRETLSSGKNKHASYITGGMGKKKKRYQKNDDIDEKKIQTGFKPRNKKDLYKNKTSQQLTKLFKELKKSCSSICSPSYCNTEALKKGCLTGSIASSEALKRCFCSKKIQKTNMKLPKDLGVITVGRVAIEQMSSKYFKQSKYAKLSSRNKSSCSKEIVTILPFNSNMLNCSRKPRLKSRSHCHPCLKIDKSINSKLLSGNPESLTNLKQLREMRKINNNDNKRLKYNNLKGNSLADAEKQTRSSGIKKVLNRFACFFSRQRSTSSGTNPICEGIKFNTDGKSTKSDPQPEITIYPHSKISKSLKNDKTHRKRSREKHQRPIRHQKQFYYKYDSGDSPQLPNELKYTSKKCKHVLTGDYWSFNNEKSKEISPYAKDYIVGHCMTKTNCKKKDGVYKCESRTSLHYNSKRNCSSMKRKLKMKQKYKVRGGVSSVTLCVVKPPPKKGKWDNQEKRHSKKARRFKSDEPHGEWLTHIHTNHNCTDCVSCCEEKKANESNTPILSSDSFRCPDCHEILDANLVPKECKGNKLNRTKTNKVMDYKQIEEYKPNKLNNNKKNKQFNVYRCSNECNRQRCDKEMKRKSDRLRCPSCGEIIDKKRFHDNKISPDVLRCPNCRALLDANFILKEIPENKNRSYFMNHHREKRDEPLVTKSKPIRQKTKEEIIIKPSGPTQTLKPTRLSQTLKPTMPSQRIKPTCRQNALLELKLSKSTYKVVNKSDTSKFLKRLKDNPHIEPCESIYRKEKLSDRVKTKFIQVMANLKKVNDVLFNVPEKEPLEVRLDSDEYCILNKEQTARGLKYWKQQDKHKNELEHAKFQLRSLFKRSRNANLCVCKARVCDHEVGKMRKEIGLRHGIQVPCTCGSRICRRRALHAAKRKQYQELHGKGIPRKEYEDIMKYIHAHRRQPSLKIVKALLQGRHRGAAKSIAFPKKMNLLLDRMYEDREERRIRSELQKVARRRHRYYRERMAIADKMVSPEDSNGHLLGESALDLLRLGGTLTESAARLTYRTVMYPSRTCKKIKDTVTCKPARVKSKTFKTAEFVTKSTFRRVGRRLFLTSYFSRVMRAMYRSKIGTAFVFVAQSILFPKRKPEPVPKVKDEKIDFGCSLFIASLRKKPCLWVYECCPWFYPHCISILTVWRQLTNLILFLLAIVVWSPCIFVAEACRGLWCCSMCTQ